MHQFYGKYLKRFFDIILSLSALIIFSPIMILVGVLLFVSGHKKILFVQNRVGLNNKVFKLVKFTSMSDSRDSHGHLLPDQDRLTSVGKFIRKTSLDELPQLLIVLKGDMSLIGPRPLLVEYLPLYNVEQIKRHLVRPGISGWAQVNGRNAISWEKKFEYDIWYVKHQSFLLDLKIVFLTILNILQSRGISQDGQATMKAFTGTKS